MKSGFSGKVTKWNFVVMAEVIAGATVYCVLGF